MCRMVRFNVLQIVFLETIADIDLFWGGAERGVIICETKSFL